MKIVLFYLYLLLFFLCDIVLRGFTHHTMLQTMLGIFCILIFHSRSYAEIFFVILLMCLEDFIEINTIGLSLLYSIPLTLIGLYLQRLVHRNAVVPIYCFFLVTLLCKIALLAYFNNFKVYEACTFYAFCINIGVISLCLKLVFKGRLGNRL